MSEPKYKCNKCNESAGEQEWEQATIQACSFEIYSISESQNMSRDDEIYFICPNCEGEQFSWEMQQEDITC